MAKKNRRWLERHVSDPYVQKAQQAGYRSRATFKLDQIQQKDKLIKPGMVMIDLGAAPGGWSQYAADIVGDRGRVIALDILPMDALAGVEFIQGDFQQQEVFDKLLECLNNQPVDLVISDIAPNMSGMRVVDQPKAMYLAELALDLALSVLKPSGDFLIKVFQGEGIDAYRKQIQMEFQKLLTRKPQASRAESRELYLLGKSRIVKK
ncbi:MAG: 23S rRNA (uridine(2552)-2'-O)-methyltransferase RlmE [Gammaproteobacteria bacterium]|nr:23S rRNA (uridine(2552)-2'-O)-methyltransferase RlmE [Gammaproteobacteria bacterium]